MAIQIAILAVAICLIAIRMVRGPTIYDRILALDTLTLVFAALLLLLAGFQKKAIYVDVAIVYAFVGFLSTLAYLKYLERG